MRWLTLIALMTLLTACVPARASDEMTLLVLNVGKADAMLLDYGGTLYLIDTGTAESWGSLSRALKMLEIRHLDGVIVTHADKDHIGGVPMLAASSIEVDAWYASRYSADVKEESEHPVLLAARSRGQEPVWLGAGDALPLGDGSLTVLAPLTFSEEENDNSLILLAEGAGGHMLLMGDAELPAERAMLAANPSLPRCQVLKVGHHGADDATSDALLTMIQPQVAVISTSTAEREETPAPGLLRRLRAAGAAVGVTQDSEAGVRVTLSDGQASLLSADWAALPETAKGVRIADKDNEADILRLVNDGGETVDLTDWFVRSEKGGEVYVFPAGTTLAPGASLTLGTLSTDDAADLTWNDKNVWHNKKDDAATLCDAYGRVMDIAS